MDIEKEKSAFLDIYKYYPSAIKFTFDVENECFVLSKKNPLDHEVEVMSQMNQQWQAWLRRAKLEYEKLDGFVVVPKSELEVCYLDESEGMYLTDADFLADIDIGEVVEVECQYYWKTTPLFAAITWDEPNNDVGYYEFYDTQEEAEKAAAHCKAMVEAARAEMSNRKIKTCDYCDDGAGECIFPYYGLAPHVHTKPIGGTVFLDIPFPENFSPDGDGLGVYTHCLNCGGDGTYDGVVLEPKADTEG